MNLRQWFDRQRDDTTFDPSSFAVLTGNDEELSRLQINYWAYCKDGEIHHIDIGLEFKSQNRAIEVGLFVPFKIAIDEISSLAAKMSNATICSAIFNEHCTQTTDTHDALTNSVTLSESGEKKLIIDIPRSAFKIGDLGSGSLVRFRIKKYEDERSSRYVRVRISSPKTAHHVTTTRSPMGSLFQSVRTQDREIDFRVNSIRSMDQEVFAVDDITLAKFDIGHLFLLVDSSESLLFHNGKSSSNRYLEIRAWKEYLPTPLAKKQSIFAYHWKGDQNKNEISIFARTNYASSRILWIIIYLALTISLAFGVNIGSSYIYSLISHSSTQSANP